MELLNGAMFPNFQVVEKMPPPPFLLFKELWILQAEIPCWQEESIRMSKNVLQGEFTDSPVLFAAMNGN